MKEKILTYLELIVWSVLCILGALIAFFTYHDILMFVIVLVWIVPATIFFDKLEKL